MNYILVTIFICTSMLLSLDRDMDILAAVYDNGCSSHPHKVIEQKQIKDTYNYDSLRSEG